MGRPETVKDIKELLKNENYQKYYELKLEIQSRYPREVWDSQFSLKVKERRFDMTQEFWEQWKSYQKEIIDLMLIPNSYFQEFVWDMVSDHERELQERRARGKKIKPKIEY